MLDLVTKKEFLPINQAYNSVFRLNRLSIGLVVPIETYAQGPVPTMANHVERVQLAEELGFSAVWLRDVPFNVPSFGDAGQTYDPFVYLGLLAGQTKQIALGVASIILPLRHPAHVAKAAATVDVLSEGRLLLGVASGDRPEEYPALNQSFTERGDRFRESFDYIRQMGQQISENKPTANSSTFDNTFGHLGHGIDMLPKPLAGKLPMLITGSSRQDPKWIAQHGDGWITYPRNLTVQSQMIQDWQTRVSAFGHVAKPMMQPLYIDLVEDAETPPRPIHLGFQLGTKQLLSYLKSLEKIGMNHVALNLRFNQADTEKTLERLASDILPEFTL